MCDHEVVLGGHLWGGERVHHAYQSLGKPKRMRHRRGESRVMIKHEDAYVLGLARMAADAPRPITQLQTPQGGGEGARRRGALRGSILERRTQPRAEGLVRPQRITCRRAREKAVDGLEFPRVERIDVTPGGRTCVSRYRIDCDEQRFAPPSAPIAILPRGQGNQHQNQKQRRNAQRLPPPNTLGGGPRARRQSDGSTLRASSSP